MQEGSIHRLGGGIIKYKQSCGIYLLKALYCFLAAWARHADWMMTTGLTWRDGAVICNLVKVGVANISSKES